MMKGCEMKMTPTQVLALVARSTFRPLDSYDHDSFAGVEAYDALIHYPDQVGEEYTIILDGNKICLIADGEEQQFHLGDNIFD
jgi:hypothetical protein